MLQNSPAVDCQKRCDAQVLMTGTIIIATSSDRESSVVHPKFLAQFVLNSCQISYLISITLASQFLRTILWKSSGKQGKWDFTCAEKWLGKIWHSVERWWYAVTDRCHRSLTFIYLPFSNNVHLWRLPRDYSFRSESHPRYYTTECSSSSTTVIRILLDPQKN